MINLNDKNFETLTHQNVPFGIFPERSSNPEPNRLFYSVFGKLPSTLYIPDIDRSKTIEYISDNLSELIQENIKEIGYHRKNGKKSTGTEYFLLKNEFLIYLDFRGLDFWRLYLIFHHQKEKEAVILAETFLKFRKRQKTVNRLYMIVPSDRGLETKSIEIKKQKTHINLQYNDDLCILHSEILKHLKSKNSGGLFLFYGVPGTGKSTYIKNLIQSVKKDIIFISPNLAGNLDSPGFTKFLIENRNAVFVIEDAENLIVSRDSESNSAISTILNLTDGLLGESLGIQFICTFNTNISRIDKALLRKGRLKALYEFQALSTVKSNQLLESLGVQHRTGKPMTLAEIYNLHTQNFSFEEKRNAIGFAV